MWYMTRHLTRIDAKNLTQAAATLPWLSRPTAGKGIVLSITSCVDITIVVLHEAFICAFMSDIMPKDVAVGVGVTCHTSPFLYCRGAAFRAAWEAAFGSQSFIRILHSSRESMILVSA